MIETATGTSLRERAIAAYAISQVRETARQAEYARAEAEREAQQLAKYLSDFQAQLDKRGFDGVLATDREIVVEGVTLTLRYMRDGQNLVALVPCRDCGTINPADTYVQSLAAFGWVLLEWLPEHADFRCQKCTDREWYAAQRQADDERERERFEREIAAEAVPAPPRAPSVEDQLVEALRRFVVEIHDGDE